MYIILCLDDNNGLAFNHRRQSQDRIVAEDISKTVGEKKLWITDYSRKLFQAVSNLEISENPKWQAKKGEYVFQELETLDTDDEQIEQFIIYLVHFLMDCSFYMDHIHMQSLPLSFL